MVRQPGLFDLYERYRKLSEVGDPLPRLKELIDFEVFRQALAKALNRSDGSKGGRPSYDAVLMFKVLILQTLYTLSDDATEFQIRDRFSFMRFLGLELADAVPDAKTIWLFREQLTRSGAIEELFSSFDAYLKAQGYLALSGQIVDATIVAAPRQRNTDEEKKAIKEGSIPQDWKDKPAKLAQKDRDAGRTLKRAKARPPGDHKKPKVAIAIPVFGYKNHVSIDRAHGLVRRFKVTPAAAHDGARLPDLLDKTNTARQIWADTAYRSTANERHMAKNGFVSKVHFRRCPGADLTASQAKANAVRSKVRSAIETVFAAQKHRFRLFVRTIGIARATVKIGLANIVSNVTRLIWLRTRIAPA